MRERCCFAGHPVYIRAVDHRCIRTCGFCYYPCGTRTPLNYAVSILPVIARLFPFRRGTKSRFQSRESTAQHRIANDDHAEAVHRDTRGAPSNSCRTIARQTGIPGMPALRVAACHSAENFRLLGRICGRQRIGDSAKLNTIAQNSTGLLDLPLCANRAPPLLWKIARSVREYALSWSELAKSGSD